MNQYKSQLFSWVKFLIGWPLSALSIIFIIKLIIDKSNQLSINFKEINLLLLLFSVVIFFIYYLVRNFLWWQMLKERGVQISFRENTYRYSFSELKRYTPGNIWSFLSRASLFEEVGVDRKTVSAAIIADIQLVIIGCGVVSLIAIPWLLNSPTELKTTLGGLIPVSVVASVAFFLGSGYLLRKKSDTSVKLSSSFVLPGFDWKSKLKLSIIAVLAYFIYGVWNYVIYLALFSKNIENPLTLIAFFVFSLLVGFLSFITPTGLGVREGVVTLGLSKIMSVTNAGIIAIFSRIAFIVCELLFLALVFIWEKISLRK